MTNLSNVTHRLWQSAKLFVTSDLDYFHQLANAKNDKGKYRRRPEPGDLVYAPAGMTVWPDA